MIVAVASITGVAFRDFTCIYSCRKSAISGVNWRQSSFHLFEGTPILVQLYVVCIMVYPPYYKMIQIDVSSWNKIIFIYITYGLNTAAFQSETFRAAILSVPVTQKEASIACGLTKTQMYRQVILPQVVRVALPAFWYNYDCTAARHIAGFTIGGSGCCRQSASDRRSSDLPYT